MHEITGLREPANSISGQFDDSAERRLANRAVGVSAVGLAVTGLVELVIAADHRIGRAAGDALHNLSDVSTSAVVFPGFRISRRTPTERYPMAGSVLDLAGLGSRWSSGPARRSPGWRACTSCWPMGAPATSALVSPRPCRASWATNWSREVAGRPTHRIRYPGERRQRLLVDALSSAGARPGSAPGVRATLG